ncbi:DNA recombination/repair protein RecA, partial [Patescibacteria group bacterium]|nr:DNA recombination/repair protein RecA [Patescibacteria group bacterium]
MAKKKRKEVKKPEHQKDASAKLQAIKLAMDQIEKQYGRGSIMRLGQKTDGKFRVSSIPTGSIALDVALGIGGLPQGRIVEIYGPEASGKTSLALHVIAEAQKRGGQCAFVDAEHALDPAWAE